MNSTPPGAHRPVVDHWGGFKELGTALAGPFAAVIDRRVATLHPELLRVLRGRRPVALLQLAAGERTKSLRILERVLGSLAALPRTGTLVAIGGGTIGDLSTVAAHVHKRGVRLVHVPTTLLAAVDSSVGGKGAVNVGPVKNGAGVFHYAAESWLCPKVFSTLSEAQLREGAIEAWKMAACLSPESWSAWRSQKPELETLVRASRAMKAEICQRDPYEQAGLRQVLNFGHTFGHVLESVSDFRVRHGDAVGLGMSCALDVGRALGVTPAEVAVEVEEALAAGPGVLGRRALARVMLKTTKGEVRRLL
ncbi:MAG: 3-dehydroquinate synthase family protein, partial [Myxococcaceae bacterium]